MKLKRKIRKIKNSGLFQFPTTESDPIEIAGSLNRLILNVNQYLSLGIDFDGEIGRYIDSPNSMHAALNMALPTEKVYVGGIYEFTYKNLSMPPVHKENIDYFYELNLAIRNATSQEINSYLEKYDKLLDVFIDTITNAEGIISVEFEKGQYAPALIGILKGKKELLSEILDLD